MNSHLNSDTKSFCNLKFLTTNRNGYHYSSSMSATSLPVEKNTQTPIIPPLPPTPLLPQTARTIASGANREAITLGSNG